MATLRRSYSSVVSETPSAVRSQLFQLIRDGKPNELGEYLCDRRYACNMLTSMRINSPNNEYLSLLMVAVLHGHDMVVRGILSHSPDRTKTVELEGRIHSVNGDLVDKVTALWCALDRAQFTVARTLIDLGKADINHGPIHPLLIDATMRGRLDIVQFLLENSYADINQTKTNDGNTALAVAAMEGQLKSVWLLYMAGASSRTRNFANKTPIVLAAENHKFDIVHFFLENNNDNATFDELELAVASHIISQKGTEHYKSQWAIESLQYALVQRTELNIPKNIVQPIVVHDFQEECQSIDEFNQIQNNEDRLYIEALLIEERICLASKDEKLLTSLFDRANTSIEKGQFDRCLDLILHIFHLSQQFESYNYSKQFFWLFYNMFNSNIPISVNRFWETFDLIFKPSEQDHERNTSYLLATIAKVDPPEISLILNELALNGDLVANIYFHGSWAQGTCTLKSDRDIIIVTRRCQQPLCFRSDLDYFHSFELHQLFGKYDVCVYSVENFEELLKKNYLLCVQCLFLPNEFKIKEEIDFRRIYLDKYYDPIRIKKVAFYEMFYSLNLTNSDDAQKRSSSETETEQSRKDFVFKNLFHGIRFLDLACQLIQTQKISNLTSVSHLLTKMKQIRDDPNNNQSDMKCVLDFVLINGNELKSKLNQLLPTNVIKGTFEVQIRFHCKSNTKQLIENIQMKCQTTKYRIVSRQLDPDKNNIFKHLIVIGKYDGQYPSIIQQIQEDVHEHFQEFVIEDIRIKSSITNEGVPINDIDKRLFWNEKIFSFQFHYQIPMKQKLVPTIQRQLKSNSTFYPYLSFYIIKQIHHQTFDCVVQMSLSDVGRDTALQMHKQFNNFIRGLYRQVKIQEEFRIYDTNIDLMQIKDT